MQDSTPTAETETIRSAFKAPEAMKGYGEEQAPASMINKNDRVIPQEGDDAKKTKSKFARDMARPLSMAELTANLEIDQLDESKIKVKKAWLTEDNHVKIDLANGESISFGRDADGYARITAAPPPDGGPRDATTTIAMAALAAARGWESVSVHGSDEEFRALSFLAISNAGLQMINPPPSHVIDKYRERFQTTLETGVDPVAEAHRQEVKAAADKPAPTSPAGDKPDAQAVKPPAVKAPEQEEQPKARQPVARNRPALRM